MTKPINGRRRRVEKLSTVATASIEIARIYRQCRHGDMDSAEAYPHGKYLELAGKMS